MNSLHLKHKFEMTDSLGGEATTWVFSVIDHRPDLCLVPHSANGVWPFIHAPNPQPRGPLVMNLG